MKAIASFLLLVLIVSLASAEPFVVIVRHAEKAASGGNDPELSVGGLIRAGKLAEMLRDSGITAIFTSEFKRTQQTAEPTAKKLGITPTVVPGRAPAPLVSKLHELRGNALVVGHGNTIADLVKALGIDQSIQLGENDYDGIFIVTLGSKPQLLRLHYPNERMEPSTSTPAPAARH